MDKSTTAGITPPPKLLTIPQVAAMLQIGRDTTYALVHSKELRHIKMGSRYLVPPAAVDEYITTRLSAPVPPAPPRAIRGRGKRPKCGRAQRKPRGFGAVRQDSRQGGDQ